MDARELERWVASEVAGIIEQFAERDGDYHTTEMEALLLDGPPQLIAVKPSGIGAMIHLHWLNREWLIEPDSEADTYLEPVIVQVREDERFVFLGHLDHPSPDVRGDWTVPHTDIEGAFAVFEQLYGAVIRTLVAAADGLWVEQVNEAVAGSWRP
jgi:hypothetical protein